MLGRHKLKLLSAAVVSCTLVWFWTRPVPATPGMHLRLGIEAMEKSEYSKAEQHFRAELQLVEGQPVASERLAMMLIQSGRRWEASKYIRTFLAQDTVRQDILALLTGDPRKSIRQPMIAEWHQKSPDDPAPLIGFARIAFTKGETEEAQGLIKRILSLRPNELEAHVLAGEIILKTAPTELSEWNKSLPESSALHPGIWYIRADWCEKAGEPEMAARCFLEGLRLDPNDRRACLRLGELLGPDRGAPFLERAELLRQMLDLNARIQQANLTQIWNLVETARSLGRVREAGHWARISTTMNPQLMVRMTMDLEFSATYREIMKEAETRKDLNPAADVSLSDFPEWQPPKL